jgi:hypothetical protein
MTRSGRKPQRATDDSADQASTKQDKTMATPATGKASVETASEAASTTSAKRDMELAGFQSDLDCFEPCSRNVPKQARQRAPLGRNLLRSGCHSTLLI